MEISTELRTAGAPVRLMWSYTKPLKGELVGAVLRHGDLDNECEGKVLLFQGTAYHENPMVGEETDFWPFNGNQETPTIDGVLECPCGARGSVTDGQWTPTA